MKLLFDENLSPALVARLRDVFPDSVHVRILGMQSADDLAIWQHARSGDLVIVTKDDDFRALSMLRGHPPKVIWLTMGNCTTDLIERLLREHRAHLEDFAANPNQSLVTISI